MKSLSTFDDRSKKLMVINDDADQCSVRYVPVSALEASHDVSYAPSFGIIGFDRSPKGEIELRRSSKQIKPKVILKAINRSGLLADKMGHGSFDMGNSIISEIRDKSPTPRIATYTETNINDHIYYLGHRFAGKFGQGNFRNTHINMIFGVCLFDNESVCLVNGDTNHHFLDMRNMSLHEIRVDDIVIDNEWTLYETELITRLSRCLADTAVSLSKETRLTIRYNIPRVEYYCYLLRIFEAGNIGKSCLLRWFDAVDERHERVARACTKLIRDFSKPLTIDIVPANTFGHLESFIRHHVVHGKTPSLRDAMTMLAKKYPLWNEVSKHYSPRSFVDLVRLSYAYEYIAAGKSVCEPDDTVCLAVEAYHEARILDYAESFVKSVPPRSVYVHAMYPMRQVALYPADDNSVAVDLYRNRPHPDIRDENGNAFDPKAEFSKLFN